MADVRFEQATRIYPGSDVAAVHRLDLEIEDGEFMVLVGPSAWKSTALRMLAGLEDVDEGGIWVGGRDVTYARPKDRDVAMVFQNYALYPYLTVAANIGFPLKMAKIRRAERERRVREVAEMLGLADLLERKPAQLSGGQRQRVAMGRAIVRQPSVYLMDEPLSNLDAKLRVQMRADVAGLQARLGVTTVYVTHDQAEAMTLGHRVAVLKDGRLQQCAAPRGCTTGRPTTFVAGFIGSPAMSLCTVSLGTNGRLDLGDAAVALNGNTASAATTRGSSALWSASGPSARGGGGRIPATVEVVEELGADAYVFCLSEVAGGQERLTARIDARRTPKRGDRIKRPVPGEAHLFDPETGERLPD